MDYGKKITAVLFFRYFYILNIESLQLIVIENSLSLVQYKALNEHLMNIDYELENFEGLKTLSVELKWASYHFIKFSSYIILSECIHFTYTSIVSLFMDMELVDMTYNFVIILCSWISIGAWLLIQITMILLVIHQAMNIHQEVGFHP